MELGQINRGSLAGETLFKLAIHPNNKVFVEIGSWNGRGSTKCIMDGLINRGDESYLISIEADKEFFDSANSFWQKQLFSFSSIIKDKLKLSHGRVIEPTDMLPIEEIMKSEFAIEDYKKWYADDIKNMSTAPNLFDSIPDKIDVLILDGGEFSTYPEYLFLSERSKIIVCDDSSVYKCAQIREELLNDTSYVTIIDEPNHRNGFCVFEQL